MAKVSEVIATGAAPGEEDAMAQSTQKARELIEESRRASWLAEGLTLKLQDARAARMGKAVRNSVDSLMDFSQSLHAKLADLQMPLHRLSATCSDPSTRDLCNIEGPTAGLPQGELKNVVAQAGRLAEDAASLLKDVERAAWASLRTSWPSPGMAVSGNQPQFFQAINVPVDAEDKVEESPEIFTAAGCSCQQKEVTGKEASPCESRGHQFNWCLVSDKTQDNCPLRFGGGIQHDITGQDHSIAGVSTLKQSKVSYWDYCSPPLPGSVHHGCECADRTDLYEKYTKDPAYQNDGRMDWDRIPFRDRLSLEAMVKLKASAAAGVNLQDIDPGASQFCVTTPSSGAYRVCPIADKGGSAASSSWCRQRSWDICMPPESGVQGETPVKGKAPAKVEEEESEVIEPEVMCVAVDEAWIALSALSPSALPGGQLQQRPSGRKPSMFDLRAFL